MLRNLVFLAIFPACLWGQTLEQRIQAVGTGTVHLSFAARHGVCGAGKNSISIQDESDDWEAACEAQPVRVALRVSDHRIVGLRTYVGGRWRAGARITDLGTVRPQEAAAYFLALAERAGRLSGDPLLPATLADSVTIWPSLLRLARANSLPQETRRTAVFWLGQAAGAAAGHALDSIAGDDRGDREVRKHAILSRAAKDRALLAGAERRPPGAGFVRGNPPVATLSPVSPSKPRTRSSREAANLKIAQRVRPSLRNRRRFVRGRSHYHRALHGVGRPPRDRPE